MSAAPHIKKKQYVSARENGSFKMKQPGHAHAITLTPLQDRVRVIYNKVTIASTTRAMELKEGSLPPVYYIPREDADGSSLERTAHRSHCPFKGDAAYFTISAGGKAAANAAWSYEQPYPAVDGIRRYLAFYSGKVDAITLDPLDAGAERGRA